MNFKKNWKRFWTLSSAREGFTLVELIVVIAILAGVAVPAYSGYVKKAERAADEQLLAALNTAFASACMTNGESNVGRPDVDATLSNGAFTYNAPFKTDFDGFYEGGEFKVFEAIVYNAKTGMFMETSAANGTLYEKLKDEYGPKIAILAASNFGAIGAENLLTEVGSVVGWADAFGLIDYAGGAFDKAFYSYLGINLDDYDLENAEDVQALVAAQMAAIERLGGDADAIEANAIALYAAQNTSDITHEGVSKWLDGSNTTDDLKNAVNASTLAEAAAIYGLYMSYAESKGIEFDNQDGNALTVMGDALSDADFAAWVTGEEGLAELEAYKASMAIISGAAADEETRGDILANGFSDEELIAIMESLMGN